jgi:hypothetical protein
MLRFLLPFFATCLLVGADSPKKADVVPERIRERLRDAFPGDKIVNADTLFIRSKRLLIAFNQMTFEGGRMKLTDCAIVQIEKEEGQGKTSRPTAVRASEAYLTFDKPLSAIADLGNQIIVSAELPGGILLAFEKE